MSRELQLLLAQLMGLRYAEPIREPCFWNWEFGLRTSQMDGGEVS